MPTVASNVEKGDRITNAAVWEGLRAGVSIPHESRAYGNIAPVVFRSVLGYDSTIVSPRRAHCEW